MPVQPQIAFFMGKGGTGKSTLSVLTALHAAGKNKRVHLVSLDSAHNLEDILEHPLSDHPQRVTNHLFVREVDTGLWIQRYLEQRESELKESYRYLSALNLEKNFRVIRYAPGMEEYALLMAFRNITEQVRDADLFIFDMPPTALTLRFLALPTLSVTWLDELIRLRKRILEKKKIISRVKLAGREWDNDRVLGNLNKQKEVYEQVHQAFTDSANVHINLVTNPDPLAQAETERILGRLGEMDIRPAIICRNKQIADVKMSAPGSSRFKPIPEIYFPAADFTLCGLPALYQYRKLISEKLDLICNFDLPHNR